MKNYSQFVKDLNCTLEFLLVKSLIKLFCYLHRIPQLFLAFIVLPCLANVFPEFPGKNTNRKGTQAI